MITGSIAPSIAMPMAAGTWIGGDVYAVIGDICIPISLADQPIGLFDGDDLVGLVGISREAASRRYCIVREDFAIRAANDESVTITSDGKMAMTVDDVPPRLTAFGHDPASHQLRVIHNGKEVLRLC